MNYKETINKMSKAGLADSAIARICNVSVFVIRSVLLTKDYEATKRTQERINIALDNFREEIGLDK